MMDNLALRRTDEPPRFHNFYSQYRWFCQKYEKAVASLCRILKPHFAWFPSCSLGTRQNSP